MLRAVLSATCSCFLLVPLAGAVAEAHLHQHSSSSGGGARQLQEGSPCGDTWELAAAAGTSSGPSEIVAALAEAGACVGTNGGGGAVVVSVQWAGSIQTSQPFSVPSGVELRVVGGGWFASYDGTSEGGGDDGNSSGKVMEADGELAAAITDAADADGGAEDLEPSVISSSSGNTSLFVVEAGGALRLSKITLSGAWGGAGGGGAVRSVGGDVTGEDVRWKSLSAEGAGGAIFAGDGANVTLAGLHLFQGCASSADGGGALFARDASVSFDGGARVFFEGCTAGNDGGGVELAASALALSSGSRTRFRGCSAADKGGGLYIKDSTVDVGGDGGGGATLEFQGCAAGDTSGAKGGGVCSFESTFAVGAGGAVTFSNNSSPVGDGGGFYGQATPLHVAGGGGATLRFANNRCGDSGGGLALEWLSADEDTACLDLAEDSAAEFVGNGAVEYGGGAYIAGCEVAAAGSEVSFRDNTAERAGALYIDEAGVFVSGGTVSFVGNSADRWGGAVYLLDSRKTTGGGLHITGGLEFAGNVAGRSGGAIYIENGDLTISGDAGEEDGVARGSWVGNTAGYDGGVISVDGGGVHVEGGFADSNRAAQRGGILFGTGESTVVWAGGESRNNSAAAGGALYLSSSVVNLTDLRLAGDHTPSGPNVFLAAADVRAVNVTLAAPAELEATFALQVDSGSTLRAFGCGFEGWDGNSPSVVSEGAVVLDACDFSGSGTATLVTSARAPAAVVRNAILGDRNFDREGFNASSLLGVGVRGCALLPAALRCAVPAECVDAENGMGVLCPAFLEAATGGLFSLTDAAAASSSGAGAGGSSSSSSAAAKPAVELSAVESSSGILGAQDEVPVFYYPDVVARELVLRRPDTAADEEENGMAGAGGVLWELRRTDGGGGGGDGDGDGGASEVGEAAGEDGVFGGASPDNFTWAAVPWSGFLTRGQEVTIKLVGTPPPPEDPSSRFAVYNGGVGAEFLVVSRTAAADSSVASGAAAVESMFYYCGDGSYWDGDGCVSCAEEMATMVAGEGALDCSVPGVTLDTLPLAKGYWRGDVTRTFVRECPNPSACIGGRGMDTAAAASDSAVTAAATTPTATLATDPASFYDETRYCVQGHKGAYCSVCADGYRRLSAGQLCVSCDGGWSGGARAAVWVLGAAAPVVLIAVVVFLIGGLSAVSQLKDKVTGGSKAKAAVSAGSGGSAVAPARSARRVAADNFWGRLVRAVPFQKLKILIVVWQILTQFSHLAEVPYPPTYQRFLNMLDIFNFDITWPLNATCLVGNISFYQRLVGVTLGPLVLLVFLSATYAVAMRVHRGSGFGRAAAEARQRAVVRHASAALLVLFLVFSSVSTTVFSTYACDYVEDLDVSLLRADYSISCDHPDHVFYEAYAALMIVLYPIGIPVLFAVLLLRRRHKINPPLLGLDDLKHPSLAATSSSDTAIENSGGGDVEQPPPSGAAGANRFGDTEASGSAVPGTRAAAAAAAQGGRSAKSVLSDGADGERRLLRFGSGRSGGGHCSGVGRRPGQFMAALEREEVLENRAHNPDLQSTRFLWEPYEPDNYYYETVECGRRCLLTGALVFVLPNTAGQAAGACVFAFLSLLAFELLRPHLSPTDAWMYRVGCVVVFFSNFLALMAKSDVSDEKAQSQETFGLLLIAVHASMVVAVIAQVYLSMQATSESRDEYLESLLKKNSSEDPKVPHSGGGDGRGGESCSSAGLPEFDATDGAGAERAGHAVMWKGDAADADEERRCRSGASSGWEDVEGRKRSWGRRSSNSYEDDGIEDSVELESVYSRRGKTSLIAGSIGSIAGSIGLPSLIKKRNATAAAVGARRTHGRALSIGSSSPGSPLPSFAVSPRTGHVLRRSAGGGGSALPSFAVSPRTGHVLRRSMGGGGDFAATFGGGFGGDADDGRRKNRRSHSAKSLSSSLSPVRQIKNDGGGSGGQPFRAIGSRAVVDSRPDRQATAAAAATTASSAVPDSLSDGRGGGVEDEEDTTAAKLERLHSLSGGLGASSPALPTLAATVKSRSAGPASRRVRPHQRKSASAAARNGGFLGPPPSPPELSATLNSVSEGGVVARQTPQQRKKKPRAGATLQSSSPPCLKPGPGGERRRPRGNSAEGISSVSETRVVSLF